MFHELDDLSDANLEVIDAACDRFAAAWKAGESPRLEDAIQEFGEPLRMLATIELVELTMSLRIQAGESPAIDEYVEKFPQWAYELRSRIQMGSMPNKDASAKKSAVFAIRGYEILGEIGRGGMGMVYKARDLDLGRIVAIKIATTGINVSAAERARFRTEVEAVAKLQHPNVVQVFESGDAGDIPYFTMEYVAGGDLAGLMARSPISATESAQLLELLARAVQCAHEAGIIHRDLKPSNVLLHENKDSASNSNKPATSRLSSSSHRKPSTVGGLFPKLTDFGLAKQLEMHQSQTVSGTIVGTPSYMSPEQSLGNPMEIGPATDVYSLGAILYEALVGRPPFRGADYVETLNQVRSQSPLPPKKLQPQLPRDLETICLKCLEKSPGQRYASALDLADDLSRFNQGLPIVARPIGWLEKGTRWAQRRPVLAGLLVAIATLLIAVITIPSLMAWRLDVALRQSDDNARQARDNETKAQDALKQAVALSRESQSRLVGMRISTGINAEINNSLLEMLLWFEKAWQDDIYSSRREDHHRLRLASALSRIPRLDGLCIEESPILDFQLHPTKRWVLVQSESNSASLWAPFEGTRIGTFHHGTEVSCVGLGVNGSLVATGGGSSIKLWGIDSFKVIRELQHPGKVNSIACHEHLDLVASACEDGKVRLWNTKIEDCQTFSSPNGAPIRFVSFDPSGERVLGVDDSNMLSVWRVKDGMQLVEGIAHQYQKRNKRFNCRPIFVREGTRLITASDRKLFVWDTDNWTVALEVEMERPINGLSANEDGLFVVASTGTTTSALLKLKGDQLLSKRALINSRQCSCGEISMDGDICATASTSGIIQVWNTKTAQPSHNLRHCEFLHKMRLERLDGKQYLIAGGIDGTLRIWNLEVQSNSSDSYDFDCGFANNAGRAGNQFRQVSYSPDGKYEFRAKSHSGQIRIRDTGEKIGNELPFDSAVKEAAFSTDGCKLAIADSHAVTLFASGSGLQIREPIRGDSLIRTIRISRDASRILILRESGRVGLWDAQLGTYLDNGESDLSRLCPAEEIQDIELSPNGKFLVVRRGGPNNMVFRVDDGRLVGKTDPQSGVAAATKFSADGQRFIVCNSDTRARVWNVDSNSPVGPFLRHPTFVRYGCLSPDGTMAATFSADNQIRIWSSETGDLLHSIMPEVSGQPMWFSEDSSRLLISPNGNTNVLFRIPKLRIGHQEVKRYVELMTGQEVDNTEGIAELNVATFRNSPDLYLRAWLNTVFER